MAFTLHSTDRLWTYEWRSLGKNQTERMSIVRLADGGLLILSPCPLSTQLQLALSNLGAVTAILASNASQHEHLSDWWLAYREAYLFAPPSLVQRRTDLNFDAALGSTSAPQWRGDLLQSSWSGSDRFEEIILCDPISKTLLVSDALLWAHPSNPLQWCIAAAQGCNRQLAMPFNVRQQFINRTRLRQCVQEVLTWPFERIITRRGQIVHEGGKAVFSNAFRWLLR